MTDQPTPMKRREIDPLATEFADGHFFLFDLFRASAQGGGGVVLENRTFINCDIEGPAVMLALDGVYFVDTNFGPTAGDLRGMLFRSLNGRTAIGAIPVRNCTFRNCRFHALGITGSEDLLQQLVEQVRTVDETPAPQTRN